MPEVLAVTNTIRELLDGRYDKRRQLLHGTVTSAPLVGGRSAGYVLATVGGVAGVRVEVSPDMRTPFVVGDGVTVEGVGTPAATSYQAVNRISGMRPDSDVFVFPAAAVVGAETYAPGDILLGSTLADWSNWWYEFAEGRWRIRQGTTLQGAIGNLSGLYGYTDTVYGAVFGEYEPGKVWIATDPQNGFRIMAYDVRTFHVDTDGTLRTGRSGEAEIVIAPGEQQIAFVVGGAVQSAIDAQSRTIYGFERLGLPQGPAIEWGPIPDVSGQEELERWGFWLRNDEGERFLAILSGTAAAPEDASFRLGKIDAEHYLQMQDGVLSWAGTNTSMSADGVFTATNAVLSGTVTAAGGDVVLDSSGIGITSPAAAAEKNNITWKKGTDIVASVGSHYQGTGFPVNLTVRSDGNYVDEDANLDLRAAVPTGKDARVVIAAEAWGLTNYAFIDVKASTATSPERTIAIDADEIYLGSGETDAIMVSSSGALTMVGTATIQQKGVVWVTPGDQVDAAYNGAAARIHPYVYSEGTYDGTANMYFRLPLPYQINGLTVKITEIKFYGYTSGNSPYFNAIYLRASDLDGTYTDLISYTTDIGNGSSGDTGAVTIYSGSLSLTDFPAAFVIDLAGTGTYDDWRVYGMRIVWET